MNSGRTSDIRGPYGTDLHFDYDGKLTKSVTWSGAVSGIVAWNYDNNFNRILETVNGTTGTAQAAFGYDADELLTCASPTTCTPAGTDALKLIRSPQHGLILGIELGSSDETLQYNSFGELARQTFDFASTPILDITYQATEAERDGLGRVVEKSEVVNGSTKVFEYKYDTVRRLKEVTVNGALEEHFEYDPRGNRTLAFSAVTGLSVTGTYDDQDRLLSHGPYDYTYTANGELETKTNRETGDAWLFQYDALGNLLSVGLPNGDLIAYLVDGLGRRVGKKVNGILVRQWIYRDALKPAAELDGSGNLVSEFVYASKATVPDYVQRGGATYRVVSDHLGSPRYVVNVANPADVPFTGTYTSFGEMTATGVDWMPFGFAGGIFDSDTELVRFGARDYDPRLGRWLNRDGLLRAGEQLSLYCYSGNDPVNQFDPDGLAVRTAPSPILTWMGQQADSWFEIAGENWMNGDYLPAIGPAALGAIVDFFPYALQISMEAGPICGTFGRNPRVSNRGLMTDLPGGRPVAKSIFRNLTSGEDVSDNLMDRGGLRRTSESGVQIRLYPDGTTRIDLPGTSPPETIHFEK
jgi:RHS repeat-associated protein